MLGKFLIFGWLTILAIANKLDNTQQENIEFDPYEILQIDPASSAPEIKRAYHKLSLIYNSSEETRDEKKFMVIAKAYAVLTDEEAHKNYKRCGNPDGPGAVSVSIALPSWIFNKEIAPLLLGLYALTFFVTLPVAVGIWWSQPRKFGSDHVLLTTDYLYKLQIYKNPNMSLKRVIMILTASFEFKHSHNSEIIDRPSDIGEVRALFEKNKNLGEKSKLRPFCFWYSLKARTLLLAHLHRVELPPNTLEKDKLYIVKKCPMLLQKLVFLFVAYSAYYLAGYITISKMPKLQTIEKAMSLGPMIVQGLWTTKSPLLQLPHITEDILQNCVSKNYYVKSLLDLAILKHNDRRTILEKLSPKQYEDAMNTLARMPILEMEVHYKVIDDEDSCTITECAIVTVTVTLHRKQMTTVLVQELPSLDNELEECFLQQSQDPHSSLAQEPTPQLTTKNKQRKKKGKGGANKQKEKKGQAAIKEKRKSKENGDSESAECDSEDSDREQVGGSSDLSNEGRDGKRIEENSHQEELQNEEEDEVWLKLQQEIAKKDKGLEPKSKSMKSHSVHCPFFPEDKQEYWWIYIANKKSQFLVTVPYLMTNLVDKEEVDLKFIAPSKPGMYTYSVIARSDSYVDLFIVKTIKLDVKSSPQWEFLDEEEDKVQDENTFENSDLTSDDDDDDDKSKENWLTIQAAAYGYKFDRIEHDYTGFDPYEILQIDTASSVAEIKKAYHKLSLIYHPDRETGDEKQFMMIAKAYAALTDEEARKNYENFGNPDGPGPVSVGIALPSWIFEKEKSPLLLGLYALAFIVTLPVAVGIWWYRAEKFGSDQVLLVTEQLYLIFMKKNPDMSLKRVIMILAASLEFEHGHNSEIIDRPSDVDEVQVLFKKIENLGEKNKEKPLCFWYSLKARALLHAHLHRIELPPNTLEKDKLYIVKKCPILLQKFVYVFAAISANCLAGYIPKNKMPKLQTIEYAMSLCPMIVQGLWTNKSPLLQLPHITEDILQNFVSKKYYVKSLSDLANLKDNDRQFLLRKLSPEQYEDAMNVLARMPILEMEVYYEVLDDQDEYIITAGDRVTMTVTLNRKPMSTVFNPNVPLKINWLQENLSLQYEDQDSSVEPKPSPKWRPKDKHIKKKKQGANKQKKKGKAVSKTSLKKEVDKSTTEETTLEIEDHSNNSALCLLEESKKKEIGQLEIAKSELEDSDNFSDEEEDRKSSDDEEEWLKIQKQIGKKNKVQEGKDKKSHSVNSKFFPEDKQEYWWIYVVNKLNHTLVTVPYLMTNLVDTEEVDLKFTAPSKPGMHTYSVIARSDSYVDFYVVKTIKLDVKKGETDTSKSHPQWDFPDDDDEEDKSQESDSDDSQSSSSDQHVAKRDQHNAKRDHSLKDHKR